MEVLMMKRLLHLSCLAMVTAHDVREQQLILKTTESTTRLPKPLSDVSASLGPDNLIYIAGGCDSPFGSQFDDETGTFRCNSVSTSFYSFNPQTEEFTVLPAMPGPRYRHASVAIDNKIWVLGGRDATDSVVGSVHVYDLVNMRWRTFHDLHNAYFVSDLGGFAARGRAYFLGGFTADYRAVRRVFSINTRESWESGSLQVVRHANMIHRRGDVGVAVDEHGLFAYASGGSTHTNQFCSPLNSVEQYDLINNVWAEAAPLQRGRSGKTVIQLNDQLLALGGAQQTQKLCNTTNDNDPSNMQTPVYEIEVYHQDQWTVVDSLADYRFRSTTVVYNETVYSFGGQSVYFSVCRCHPTVDNVVIYRQQPVGTATSASNEPADVFQAGYGDYSELNTFHPGSRPYPGPEAQPLPPQTNNDSPFIDERGYFDEVGLSTIEATEETDQFDDFYTDDDEEEEEEGHQEETTQGGFGTYHREKREGFIGEGSGARKVSTKSLYLPAISIVAALFW